MDMFTTRTMLAMVQEADKSAKTFLRDRYFANRQTFSTQKIDIDIVGSNQRRLAPFVNPKVGGKVIERQGYKTNSYEAPELSPQMITTAEDMLKRSAGESIYGSKSPSQRAAEQLGRDLSELDDIITRREEVMCAEALFSGKISIQGDGYDEEVDFWAGLQPSEKPQTTLSTLWTAADADVMADLRAIRRAIIQRSGISPKEIICGTNAIEALLGKLADKGNALNMRRVDMGMIDPQHLPNGVTYWGYLNDSALDIYSYDEYYLNTDGVEVPMVPTNKVLVASPDVKTLLAYGCVSLAGDQEVKFYEGARIPDSWVQRANPSGRVVQIKSRPLPIINQVQGFHVLTVAS